MDRRVQAGYRKCWSSGDKSLNKWRETSLFLGKNKKILDAELWAIFIALEAAKRETGGNFSAPITVFTDSREALATSQQSFPRTGSPYLRGLIYISEGLRSQKKKRTFSYDRMDPRSC